MKYRVRYEYNGGSCSSEFPIKSIEEYVNKIAQAGMIIINGDPTLVINMKNVNSMSFTAID